MALVVQQEPTPTLLGTADEIVYVVFENSGNPTEAKFRYICKVTVDGTVVAKLKQLPNSTDSGVFDLSMIMSAYTAQDHNVHDTVLTAESTTAMEKYTLDFYYEYATTADDDPTEYPAAAVQKIAYAVNGTFTPVYNDYDSTNYDNYILNDDRAKFLSVYEPQNIRAQEMDKGVLAFINGSTSAPWNSPAVYFHIAYYNGTTALNSGYLTNTVTQIASTTPSQFLMYAGLFPANLEAQTSVTTLQPSDAGNANWTHYTIQVSDQTTLSGNETSAQYKITKEVECKYEAIRLAWWNELGGWDYYTFHGKHTHSEKIERKTYRSVGGNKYNADGDTTDYVKKPYEGGLKISGIRTTNEWTLNTEGENEAFNNVLDSLMNSPEVLWYKDGAWRGCVVTDTGIDFKSSINDKGIVYTVTIEESRYKPTI